MDLEVFDPVAGQAADSRGGLKGSELVEEGLEFPPWVVEDDHVAAPQELTHLSASAGQRLSIGDGALGELLLESLLLAAEADELPVGRLREPPALFPFDLEVSTYELRRSPRFEVHRQGLDNDIVALAP